MGMVSYTLDTLPPMTEEDRARLMALAEMPDSEIDFSDCPEFTEEELARVAPNPYRRASRKAALAKAH
jgi:hypothetical protein